MSSKQLHYEVEMELTPSNFKKLLKHENTLLKHAQLGKNKHSVYVSPAKAKKLQKAMKSGKGVKLTLSPQELDRTMKDGKGFKEMMRGASRFFKENVKPELKKSIHKAISQHGDMLESKVEKAITPHLGSTTAKAISKTIRPTLRSGVNKLLGDSPEEVEGGKISLRDVGRAYRQYVRPVVAPAIRKGLKTALQAGVPAVAGVLGQPELIPMGEALVSQYGDKAIDVLGKTTGAFGVKKRGVLKSDYSTFLNNEHPAMNPGDTRLTMDGRSKFKSGGSFRPSGYGVKRRGGSFVPSGYSP